MDYNEAVDFLLGLPDMERSSHGDKARRMSLAAMQACLHELGNPQLGRKTVHVTGSKGKGSTSAFIAALLAAKKPTSLYTSPHLHSYRERICLNLEPVSEQDFAAGVGSICELIEGVHAGYLGPVSTFGAMTSLFFWLSRAHQMQWQVVEVGMGGLHDATNVFQSTDLVVITAVSLEHMNVLGKTTAEIAENKAGIIKSGTDVVLAPQRDPEVGRVVRKICAEKGAHLLEVSKEYQIKSHSHGVNWQTCQIQSRQGLRNINIQMLGTHQLDNLMTAIATIDLINENEKLISAPEMSASLQEVFLPGRLEVVSESPLVVIDGAHNGESATALSQSLQRHFPSEAMIFILGANSDKNIQHIIEAIKPSCKLLIATRSQSEKAMDPGLIVSAARAAGLSVERKDSSVEAVERALKLLSKNEIVCATGSLYLIAEIREYFFGAIPSWSLKAKSKAVVD